MDFNKTNLIKTMTQEAKAAFGDGWDAIKDYAPAEFEKMAVQLVNISKNVALYQSSNKAKGYSPATGKLLVKMQRISMENVFAAISGLVLLSVQKAINAIIRVIKQTFSTALKSIL